MLPFTPDYYYYYCLATESLVLLAEAPCSETGMLFGSLSNDATRARRALYIQSVLGNDP